MQFGCGFAKPGAARNPTPAWMVHFRSVDVKPYALMNTCLLAVVAAAVLVRVAAAAVVAVAVVVVVVHAPFVFLLFVLNC
ncbi:hypothetical protein ElyMa_004230900 [Elysia marginata]|uniref:Uncharacterized protein n=1 Tax=Elysia marginata TaxID=1093978 RepID=A0AAV4GQR8_9GAST|nr:hypothetical protein ElyMa_004230900 [Elysia marginata]